MVYIDTAKLYSELVLYLMKGGVDFHTRDAVGEATASYLRQRLTNAPPVNSDPTILDSLRKTGFSWLPAVFTPDEIRNIHAYFSDKPAYFWDDDVTEPTMIKGVANQRVPNKRFISFDQSTVSLCPSFARLAHDPNLLRLAEAYLEAPPTISIIACWWSLPSTARPGGMQHYHHDRDDFRQVKFFVYLTDVEEGDGPHIFIENTHNAAVLQKYIDQRWQNPTDRAEVWKALAMHRKSDDTAAALFPKEWFRQITGKTGATFMEDTRGTHKGQPPEKGARLVFQICYGLIPKPNATYETVPRPEGVHVSPLSKYANRYFYA
jgi:hypothetical protein